MSDPRRDAVPFDPRHFERLAREGPPLSATENFRDINRRHHWAGSDSPSGAGAAEAQTARLRAELPDGRRRFMVLDLTADALPPADLLLCRDCLVHLSHADIRRALENIARSRITCLLTTTFPGGATNEDIVTGDWRPLDLERPPFSFPPPLRLLEEGCTESDGRFADKSLGLWRVADLARAWALGA